jgi:hypothetical protein
MSFDVNGQFYGQLFGQDRIGQTTPDLESSEWLRPWLPVAYPAPYLPTLRQDQGHPKLASIVIGAHQIVGQDKNGGLVPAGYFCGTQATKANGGQYCVIAYSPADVKFAFNPQTGVRVASAAEYAVLACPSDGVAGDTVTLPSGQVITIKAGDITFAETCDLFSTGKSRPIGCAVRNVYQYIGGVLVGTNTQATSSATGINYLLDGNVPLQFTVLNYMHEMGTAIQTQFVLKTPWIGATPTTLQTLANGDGITGYIQGLGRSFTHFTGTKGAAAGDFSYGSAVVASSAANGTDAGNFAPYNSAIHTPADIIGRVIGIQNLSPFTGAIPGFLNRVRTQFDRPMVGPMVDPNPAAIRMGGSATRGIPYHVSVTTDAVFVYAVDQNKTLRPEYSSHIIVRVNL